MVSKKRNKRIKLFVALLIILFIIIFVLPNLYLNLINENQEFQSYSPVDFINYITNQNENAVIVENENNIIYGDTINIKINVEDFNINNSYTAEIAIDDETQKLRDTMFLKEKDGALNSAIVGQSPYKISVL